MALGGKYNFALVYPTIVQCLWYMKSNIFSYYACALTSTADCASIVEMPFYNQFNNFTGRLKNSTQFQPLNPITPVPLQRADPPTMIWDSIKTQAIKTVVDKPKSYSTLCPKIKAKMEHFQKDMTKPVYLMGGTPDKILLGASLLLMAYISVGCFQFIGRHINKK